MSAHNKKILIVNPTIHMRSILQKMVVTNGLGDAILAEDANVAWNILEQEFHLGVEFDLILSPSAMPRKSGLMLLQQIRADERFKNIPFFMLATEDEERGIDKPQEKGITGFIGKPILEQKFAKTIKDVLKK